MIFLPFDNAACLRIDGRQMAARMREHQHKKCQEITKLLGRAPSLNVVMVGDNPASHVYIRMKQKAAEALGVSFHLHSFPSSIEQKELENCIRNLAQATDNEGILIQLPIPDHLSPTPLQDMIPSDKDIDGLSTWSTGARQRPDLAQSPLLPCTPMGIRMMLSDLYQQLDRPLRGQHAVILGRSAIVGRPMVDLLLEAQCTVTVCHSQTRELGEHVGHADIIISAVGQAGLITAEMVKTGAVGIDVGITRLEPRKPDQKPVLAGDFLANAPDQTAEKQALYSKLAAFTPVPGGVGPMTVACLMENILTSAKQKTKKLA